MRRTWGLHNQHGVGVYRMNDPSDVGGTCSPWTPDPCPSNDCYTDAAKNWPLEDYSELFANIGGFKLTNSNTFAKCLNYKCGTPYVPPHVYKDAPGWKKPCP
jgi:hypothetical protein